MNEDAIRTLEIGLRSTLDTVMIRRCAQALDFLASEIKAAYYKEFSHKSNLIDITSDVKRGEHFIEGIIGSSVSWLANIEFGERGTHGGPPQDSTFHKTNRHPERGAAFRRSKRPPIANIYRWIQSSAISIPERFKERAEKNKKTGQKPKNKRPASFDPTKPWWSDDPAMVFADAIAQKRKKYGMAGLFLIEKKANELAEKIRKFIEGDSA